MKRILSLGLAALLLCGCGLVPEEEKLHRAPVVETMEEDYFKTAEVKKGDVVEGFRVYCHYRKEQNKSYSFEKVERGESLKGLYVTEGQRVTKGTVLAEIDLGDLQNDIDAANAEVERYEQDIAFEEQLLSFEKERQALAKKYKQEFDDSKLVSLEEKIQSLKDKLSIALLKQEEVMAKVGNRQLIAEFDGTVTYVRYNAWFRLRANEEIVKVEADSYGFVCSTEYGDYFPIGEEVEVVTEAGPYRAVVSSNEKVNDKRYNLVLDAVNPDGALLPDMQGTITVSLASVEDVVYVPYGALKILGDKYAVYVLNSEGMREVRYIEVGMIVSSALDYDLNRVEVKSGVEPGELVIVR